MTATQTRLFLSQLHNVTADRLIGELSAAGWDSTPRPISELRGDVARLLSKSFGPFDLCDANNDVIRDATDDEAAESVMASAEGWVEVDGVRCYVAE